MDTKEALAAYIAATEHEAKVRAGLARALRHAAAKQDAFALELARGAAQDRASPPWEAGTTPAEWTQGAASLYEAICADDVIDAGRRAIEVAARARLAALAAVGR
jgi:hypothetical protein